MMTKARGRSLSTRSGNDVVVRTAPGLPISVVARQVRIAGETHTVDPHQLIRLIKRVTQHIGEYKDADDLYAAVVVRSLRTARGELVTILEDVFHIHWKIDEATGASVFFV